jgi:hypothetical protein
MRHPFRTPFASSSSRVLGALALPTLIAFASLTAGCSDDPVANPGGTGGGSGNYTQLTDENNYAFSSELHIGRVEVAAESDLTIKWDGIKKDIQCHDVKPAADIDKILFLRFKATTEKEVSDLLDKDNPESTDLIAPAPFEFNPDGTETTVKLSDFEANGTAFDPSAHLKDETNIDLLIFQNGTSLGQGARAMVFVDPGTSSNTTVDMAGDYSNDDCSLLEFSANLSDLTPVPVAKTGTSWKVEWTKMKTNGQGLTLARPQIDRMLLGFYAGHDVKWLEENFLDLEEDGVATEGYELKLDSTKADLSAAKERTTGAQFTGFDKGEGTWIMGLFCDACSNPAPLVLTVLNPE